MKKLKQKPSLSHLLAASLLLLVQSTTPTKSSCAPPTGCSVALANYITSSGDTVANIAFTFQTTVASIQQYSHLQSVDSIGINQALLIPFPCACSDDHLGHITSYTVVAGDTVDKVVHAKFGNLSQTQWVLSATGNVNPDSLSVGSYLNIPMNCSCGNPDVSTEYGMFLTYVIQAGDTLTSLGQKFGVDAELLSKYNENVDMNKLMAYDTIIFVPTKDGTGVYPPYISSAAGGTTNSAVIGASVGGAILFALSLGLLLYWIVTQKRKKQQTPIQESALLTGQSQEDIIKFDSSERVNEFSYEQLAKITDNFNISKRIGNGAFGTVYYAEINDKRVAIKKMDIAETQQFMAEVRVLARVHHTNLVQLVGWCREKALILVYEFVENGTLKGHLDGKGGTPLTWPSRLQIALDSARGLEYIHEYTVPSYVHRDIKPDNILLDKNLRAKVADFGLAKLVEITGNTIAGGTPGYMAPEAALGDVITPKVDVYAFGVVLMQLVSAKAAIVINNDNDKRSLQSLFEEFLEDSAAKKKLSSFVDATLKDIVLEDNHMLDSVWKVTQLACECTDFEPDRRPDMRSVVLKIGHLAHSTCRTMYEEATVL